MLQHTEASNSLSTKLSLSPWIGEFWCVNTSVGNKAQWWPTHSIHRTSSLSINDNIIVISSWSSAFQQYTITLCILKLMIDPPSSVYTLWQEGFTNDPTSSNNCLWLMFCQLPISLNHCWCTCDDTSYSIKVIVHVPIISAVHVHGLRINIIITAWISMLAVYILYDQLYM